MIQNLHLKTSYAFNVIGRFNLFKDLLRVKNSFFGTFFNIIIKNLNHILFFKYIFKLKISENNEINSNNLILKLKYINILKIKFIN